MFLKMHHASSLSLVPSIKVAQKLRTTYEESRQALLRVWVTMFTWKTTPHVFSLALKLTSGSEDSPLSSLSEALGLA